MIPEMLNRLINKPVLMHQPYLDVLVNSGDMAFSSVTRASQEKTEANIAVINIHGPLFQRGMSGSFMGYEYSVAGYDTLKREISLAEQDPDVDGIMLDMDTPGGEVAGCFDFCDWLRDSVQKPVWSLINEGAYSAGSAIVSSTDRIIMPRTASTGSVGVVTSHVDYSKYMEEQGLKVTFIYKGDHKVDGNPYEELSEETRAGIEAGLEPLYERFVSTVSLGRGIEEQAVRDTEAGTFRAERAVEKGFADDVMTVDEAYSSFATYLISGASQENYGVTMSKDSNESKELVSADEAEKLAEEARKEGLEAGVKAEQARRDKILNSEEAQNRPIAAETYVSEGLEADQAIRLLSKMPEESSENVRKDTDQLSAEMNKDKESPAHKPVSADSEDNREETPELAFGNRMSTLDRIAGTNKEG